jgi:hypothetical protein
MAKLSIPNKFRVFVVCLLIGEASVSCAGDQSESGGASLSIKPAIAVGEGPGFRRFARIKLGCTPCSEVLVEHADGDTTTYLYSDSNLIEIQSSEILEFYLSAVDDVFALGVQLDLMSQKLILEHAELGFNEAANLVDGKFVDVVPMRAHGSYYLIGAFKSREDARVVARQLGAKVIEEGDGSL